MTAAELYLKQEKLKLSVRIYNNQIVTYIV